MAKANQTISFAALPDKTDQDPDFTVSATASSGLAVSFAAAGNCSVTGTTVHLLGPGNCTITASQGGNADFNAAPSVAHSFAIRDTTPPVVQCPSDVVVEATSSAGAVVTYLATATDNGSIPTLAYSHTSGVSWFPLGMTVVTVTATDAAGNQSMCSFTVTVHDTTPPVIGPTSNLTVDSTSPSGAVVTFALPAVSDTADPAPAAAAVPASGSVFPIGTTTVRVTATDSSGNSSSTSFTITVLSAAEMTSNLMATATQLFPEAANLLQSALANLNSGKTGAACNQVNAFANQVQAQSGKKLSISDADQLIASAKRIQIQASMGCK